MQVKGLRWVIVSLVGLATVINYIDRNALAVMWPGIAGDLGLDKQHYAWIISSFMVAYAIGQAAFGKMFDVLGTRISFVISIVIWSISIGLHAIARTANSFGIFRFMLGFGEAGNWPGATKSNAEWFPTQERAFAQGLFNAGASLGSVISAPIVAIMYVSFGWRSTFLLLAILGALWIIPWLFFYKGVPAKHPWITEAEKNHILKGQQRPQTDFGAEEKPLSIKKLLAYKATWAVILSRFFLDPVWWLFVSWLPIYLADRFGFDIKEIGLFAWVPYVGATLGSLTGGWLSGYWIKHGWKISRARKISIGIGGAIMMPPLVLTAFAGNPLSAVLLIAIILFGFQLAIGNIQTLPSDYFSGKSVGSLAGLGGMAAVVGVLITTNVVPVITTVSYVPFFALGAALVPFAIASVFLLAGEIPARKEQKE